MPTKPESQRRTLGDFLRTHRVRLSPAGLGLVSGGRRRTPGLRREEVAQACGMSTTWYTWLEQGRDVSPSPRALAGLAWTLRLTPAERAYLFQLAGKPDPAAPSPTGNGMDAPASLTDAVASIAAPAYVLDRVWNARAWNAPAARLFVGWLDGRNDRNLLRYVFLSPLARRVLPDWDKRARRVVAESALIRADTSTIRISKRWSRRLASRALCSRAVGRSTRSSSAPAANAASIIRARVGYATSRSRSRSQAAPT